MTWQEINLFKELLFFLSDNHSQFVYIITVALIHKDSRVLLQFESLQKLEDRALGWDEELSLRWFFCDTLCLASEPTPHDLILLLIMSCRLRSRDRFSDLVRLVQTLLRLSYAHMVMVATILHANKASQLLFFASRFFGAFSNGHIIVRTDKMKGSYTLNIGWM